MILFGTPIDTYWLGIKEQMVYDLLATKPTKVKKIEKPETPPNLSEIAVVEKINEIIDVVNGLLNK